MLTQVSQEVVKSSPLEIFRTQLRYSPGKPVLSGPVVNRTWTRKAPEVPSSLICSVILLPEVSKQQTQVGLATLEKLFFYMLILQSK